MFGVSCGEAIWATMPIWPKSWERSCDLERTRRANEKKHFWAKWRLGESRTKKLQISIQNEHVCAKTTAKPYFHFHTKHKVLWGLQNLNMEKCLNQQITQGQLSACDHVDASGVPGLLFKLGQKKTPDSWKPVPNSSLHFTLTSFLMELRRSNFDMNNRHVQPNRFLNVDFLRRASMII